MRMKLPVGPPGVITGPGAAPPVAVVPGDNVVSKFESMSPGTKCRAGPVAMPPSGRPVSNVSLMLPALAAADTSANSPVARGFTNQVFFMERYLAGDELPVECQSLV